MKVSDTCTTLAAAIDPPAHLRMWEWCEQNIRLSVRTGTPFPGNYSTALTPWVRGWFDALQDPLIDMIGIAKAAQTSRTLTSHCWHGYNACEDPGPTLCVMPSQDGAQSMSETRVIPMFEDSPRLAQELPDDRDKFKKLEYGLKRMVLRWVGSNSAAGAKSRTIRYLDMDEPDEYPEDLEHQGSAIALMIQRTKRYWNRKIFIGGTPTTKAAYTWRTFLQGDQRRYFWPCPACGEWQYFKWAQVVFDSKLDPVKAGEGAYYECENAACKAHLSDADRLDVIQRGEWRATSEASVKGLVSFHAPGFLAPSQDVIQGLVTKFLTVKDTPADLQDFINSDLGEPWEVRPVEEADTNAIWAVRTLHRYARGTVPYDRQCQLWLLADVMKYFVEWNVWAQAPRDMMLVDHGRVKDLEELTELTRAQFTAIDGRVLGLDGVMVDSGWQTDEVYAWLREASRHIQVVPVKGDGGQGLRYGELVRIVPVTAVQGRGLKLMHLHPAKWHDALADALSPIKMEENETQFDAWQKRPVRLHFHESIDGEYVNSLTAEVLMEEASEKNGRAKRYWKRIRKANHEFDLFRYALVVRYMLARWFMQVQQEELKAGTGPAPDVGKVKEQPAIVTIFKPEERAEVAVETATGRRVASYDAEGDDDDED